MLMEARGGTVVRPVRTFSPPEEKTSSTTLTTMMTKGAGGVSGVSGIPQLSVVSTTTTVMSPSRQKHQHQQQHSSVDIMQHATSNDAVANTNNTTTWNQHTTVQVATPTLSRSLVSSPTRRPPQSRLDDVPAATAVGDSSRAGGRRALSSSRVPLKSPRSSAVSSAAGSRPPLSPRPKSKQTASSKKQSFSWSLYGIERNKPAQEDREKEEEEEEGEEEEGVVLEQLKIPAVLGDTTPTPATEAQAEAEEAAAKKDHATPHTSSSLGETHHRGQIAAVDHPSLTENTGKDQDNILVTTSQQEEKQLSRDYLTIDKEEMQQMMQTITKEVRDEMKVSITNMHIDMLKQFQLLADDIAKQQRIMEGVGAAFTAVPPASASSSSSSTSLLVSTTGEEGAMTNMHGHVVRQEEREEEEDGDNEMNRLIRENQALQEEMERFRRVE